MLAVKGHYEHGHIKLLEPIEGIETAEVIIIISEKSDKNTAIDSEKEEIEAFQMAGMHSFFSSDEDDDVDWEEIFDVKNK